eukprot:Lithocolla_globosa_v1_NODE_67_length_7144_cov_10.886601.p5 type:complete len:112 gc:universal NODE_67_length_7144_cov_10.886601:2553-2888(+)
MRNRIHVVLPVPLRPRSSTDWSTLITECSRRDIANANSWGVFVGINKEAIRVRDSNRNLRDKITSLTCSSSFGVLSKSFVSTSASGKSSKWSGRTEFPGTNVGTRHLSIRS